VWAADDGSQRLRRTSGEVRWAGQRKVSKMGVCKCKSECVGSSRMCSGSRRRRGCAGAGASKPAGGVAARAAVERQEQASAGRVSGSAGAEAARSTV
jgi:hypothetical protein